MASCRHGAEFEDKFGNSVAGAYRFSPTVEDGHGEDTRSIYFGPNPALPTSAHGSAPSGLADGGLLSVVREDRNWQDGGLEETTEDIYGGREDGVRWRQMIDDFPHRFVSL